MQTKTSSSTARPISARAFAFLTDDGETWQQDRRASRARRSLAGRRELRRTVRAERAARLITTG